MEIHAFLSYRFSSDHRFAEELTEQLDRMGVDVWFDVHAQLAGDDLEAGVAAALRRATTVLIVLSRGAVRAAKKDDTNFSGELRRILRGEGHTAQPILIFRSRAAQDEFNSSAAALGLGSADMIYLPWYSSSPKKGMAALAVEILRSSRGRGAVDVFPREEAHRDVGYALSHASCSSDGSIEHAMVLDTYEGVERRALPLRTIGSRRGPLVGSPLIPRFCVDIRYSYSPANPSSWWAAVIGFRPDLEGGWRGVDLRHYSRIRIEACVADEADRHKSIGFQLEDDTFSVQASHRGSGRNKTGFEHLQRLQLTWHWYDFDLDALDWAVDADELNGEGADRSNVVQLTFTVDHGLAGANTARAFSVRRVQLVAPPAH